MEFEQGGGASAFETAWSGGLNSNNAVKVYVTVSQDEFSTIHGTDSLVQLPPAHNELLVAGYGISGDKRGHMRMMDDNKIAICIADFDPSSPSTSIWATLTPTPITAGP